MKASIDSLLRPGVKSSAITGQVSSTVPALCLAAGALLFWAFPGSAGETGEAPATGVNLMKAPEGARVFSMPLAVVDTSGGRSQGYFIQRSQRALDELVSVPPAIAQTYSGKEFSAYEIATLPDGTRYMVVLNEDSNVKFLNRTESGMWYARIYRLPGGDGQPVLLREGYQGMNGDVTVPVQLPLPSIGATKVTSLRTEIGYTINGYQNGKPQVYSGRTATLQVSGSQLNPEGKLTLTVNVPDEMTVTPDTQVSLRLEPAVPGLPERNASGKLTDFLTLGSTRLAVTALAPDFSSASVAVVAGSLEQTLKQQLQLGTEMPPFAQVDLINRRTITREDVLAKGRASSGIIFVFGDLPSGPGRSPYEPPYRPGGGSVLPLRPEEIAEQLGTQLEPKPLVILVTRQLSLSFLYEDLRNKNPDYLVLADFVDPLRTTFRVPQNTPGYYGPPSMGSQEPSLRQLFNLPGNALSLAAFDTHGRVLYVKSDIGSAFLPTLAESRASLASGKGGK